MTVFERPGPDNTEAALRIALEAAQARGLDLAVASNTGATALRLLELARASGFSGRIVAVSHVDGMERPGENALPAETRSRLEQSGVRVVTAAHALSGGERSLSAAFRGVSPVEVLAAALRLLGQGVKVCVEIGLMAQDCGALTYGRPAVCVGGTGRGADTACVLTPGYTASLLQTKVHEILCKPGLYGQN